MNEKSSVGNCRLFYFSDDGKLEVFLMHKKYWLWKINNYILLNECTEIHSIVKDTDELCVLYFILKNGMVVGSFSKSS